MAKKKNSKKERSNEGGGSNGKKRSVAAKEPRLQSETKNSIWAIVFFCVAIILVLAWFTEAGPAGALIYTGFNAILGWGYFILPATLVFAGIVFLFSRQKRILATTLIGSILLIFSFLGLIHIFSPGKGGWFGYVLGSLHVPFGNIAALIIDIFIFVISILVTANVPLKLNFPKNDENDEEEDGRPLLVTSTDESKVSVEKASPAKPAKESEPEEILVVHGKDEKDLPKGKKFKAPVFANYVPPPLSLLNADASKPTTGDLLANANIIKRTLESFGISVEMGEINVGPAVTRYTLKPAEGVKLSRITALSPDLALSLAAHPIRIEAPIPGKSLVGIEVPNKTAALVRLGS